MLNLQNITYLHPDKDLVFDNLQFPVNKHDKIALIGDNGAGKSTLLHLIAGILPVSNGQVKAGSKPYYVPQLFGQFNDLRISEALRIKHKVDALYEILDGRANEENLSILEDDWGIEERCQQALTYWGLEGPDLNSRVGDLSGGQKTKVFLAGISIHQPEFVLLDEPSNHLDAAGREILYHYIRTTKNTLIIASHDKVLLNLLDKVCELNRGSITVYGGNYDFYKNQKEIQSEALSHQFKNKEKSLRKAREVERQSLERQQKLDAKGKKKQEKAGVPTIFLNTLRNNAEKSMSGLKEVHAERIGSIVEELDELRTAMPVNDKMKMDFDQSAIHKGKILVNAKEINFRYGEKQLWKKALDFQITSGERIAIKGSNGSGKTTLVKMLLNELSPYCGTMELAEMNIICIDQDYSLIDPSLRVYEQAQFYNSGTLQEHEVKTRLHRFLFPKAYWDKPCSVLSGGEKMRLMLCSMTINHKAPDMIILDEPTNNLDIQNIDILTEAINEYHGTLVVISHDEYFLEKIRVERFIDLP